MNGPPLCDHTIQWRNHMTIGKRKEYIKDLDGKKTEKKFKKNYIRFKNLNFHILEGYEYFIYSVFQSNTIVCLFLNEKKKSLFYMLNRNF